MAETNYSTTTAPLRPTSSSEITQGGGVGARAQGAGNGSSMGTGIVGRVKESATAQLTTQKDRGTSALDSVVQAVRSTTGKLRDDQHDTIANSLEQVATQIESWSHRLRDKDVGELLTDVQRLARRQPAVFIGSAFALGVLGARFLKSSRQDDDREYGTSPAGQRMSARTTNYSDATTGNDAASIPYGSSTGSDTPGVGGGRTTRGTSGRKSGTPTE